MIPLGRPGRCPDSGCHYSGVPRRSIEGRETQVHWLAALALHPVDAVLAVAVEATTSLSVR